MDPSKQIIIIIDKKQGSWFWLWYERIEGGSNVGLRFCGGLDISWEGVSRRFFLCECVKVLFLMSLWILRGEREESWI